MMSRYGKLRMFAPVALPLAAALAIGPAASAATTGSAAGHHHSSGVHLVITKAPVTGPIRMVLRKTPLTGTIHVIEPTNRLSGAPRLAGATPSIVRPDISRVNCSSGNDPNWARLYLDNGGATCYGFRGTMSGLNDGPAYEFCSGNNSGSVYTTLGYFTFGPINNATPNYYWYTDEYGDLLSFYVRDVSISGWSGSAQC